MYDGPVTDLWFKASSQNDTRGYSSSYPFSAPGAWYPDNVLSVLGCTEKYQFCAGGRCTNLSGIYMSEPGSPGASVLALTETQAAVYSVLWKAAWAIRLYFGGIYLEDRLLLAPRFQHFAATSAPVNPDQWILEAENLHNLSMAALQRRVVEYGSPPDLLIRRDVRTRQFIVPPPTDREASLCNNIKTRSSTHTSYSAANFLLVILAGATIIIVDFILPDLVFWVRRRRRRSANDEKTKAWIDGQVFRLHCAVLQSRQVGPWEESTSEIPVLKEHGKMFGHVDLAGAETHSVADSRTPLYDRRDEKSVVTYSEYAL